MASGAGKAKEVERDEDDEEKAWVAGHGLLLSFFEATQRQLQTTAHDAHRASSTGAELLEDEANHLLGLLNLLRPSSDLSEAGGVEGGQQQQQRHRRVHCEGCLAPCGRLGNQQLREALLHHLNARAVTLHRRLRDLPPSLSGEQVTRTPAAASSSSSGALEELPYEVLLIIAAHLHPGELAMLAGVSSLLRAVAEDQQVWQLKCRQRFPFFDLLPRNAEDRSWRDVYRDWVSVPLWGVEEQDKHRDLVVSGDGRTVQTMDSIKTSADRSIRALAEYAPGTGMHYFAVQWQRRGASNIHYTGLCKKAAAARTPTLQMWDDPSCYAFASNSSVYHENGHAIQLGLTPYTRDGDVVGMAINCGHQPTPPQMTVHFYVNGTATGTPLVIDTDTYVPCVGLHHPQHQVQVVDFFGPGRNKPAVGGSALAPTSLAGPVPSTSSSSSLFRQLFSGLWKKK